MNNKNLKILIITMDYPPRFGGLGSVTYALEKGLKEAKVNVKLLNFDGTSSNNNQKLKLIDFFYTPSTRNSYFALHKILNPLKFLATDGGFRDFVYNNMIYRISKNSIEEFNPDIVHITRSKLYSAVYNSKVPIVANCHAEEIDNTYPIKYIADNAAGIICISNFTKKSLISIFPQSVNKIEVVYPSIDVTKYKNKGKVLRKNQIIIMSRLEKAKNIDMIIKSLEYLPKNIFNKYKFLVIGEGTEKKYLIKLTKKLNLNSKVIFYGNISENEKIKLLKESKLYVLCPKRYKGMSEAFGITFVEAQAAGIPVVASRTGGISEAVGESGIYVNNVNDPQEIANKITKLITDVNLYSGIKNNIPSHIDNFDVNRWILNNIRVYKSALNLI